MFLHNYRLMIALLIVWFIVFSFWLPKSYAKSHYQTTPPLVTITADDGAAGHELGYAVAADAGTVLAGAPKGDVNGSRRGVAYVYSKTSSGWSQQGKLVADDLYYSASFGSAVDLAGDTAVVGAHQDIGADHPIPGVGSAHIFVRSGTTWRYQAKVISSQETGGWFGYTVGVDGDTVVVGAPRENYNDRSTGAAYVFTRAGTVWTQEAILVSDEVTEGALLGTAIAIDQDTLVVGARNEQSAYVFTRTGTTWVQEAKLTGDDQGGDSLFGVSVALKGDLILVGDHGYNAGAGANQGTVYVFTRAGTTWTQQQKLVASTAAEEDGFGLKVDTDGEQIIVGAPGRIVGPNFRQGATFLFEKAGENWVEQHQWELIDGVTEDSFGHGVAVAAGVAAIGAPFREVALNSDQDALYLAQLPRQQSITFSPLPSRLLSDAQFQLAATASSGLPIIYSTTTATVCRITDNVVTLLTAGQCTVTASQPGDDLFPPAPDITHSFSVFTPTTFVLLPLIYKSGAVRLTAHPASGLPY